MLMDNDTRCLKAALVGCFSGVSLSFLIIFCFKLDFRIANILPSAIVGLLVGILPAVCLPKGFSLPKDLTTISFLGLGSFCFWVLVDGILKGEIHGFPKGGFLRGFTKIISWDEYPPIFLMCALYWGGLGILTVGAPIWYFRKAIRDTSGADLLPGSKQFQNIFSEWRKLSGGPQAIVVFVIAVSSILVFFYLLILLRS